MVIGDESLKKKANWPTRQSSTLFLLCGHYRRQIYFTNERDDDRVNVYIARGSMGEQVYSCIRF